MTTSRDPKQESPLRPAPVDEPLLYGELASWFPLLTPPADYAEEAALFRQLLEKHHRTGRPETVLELGAGGGHNAFHLKSRFRMTLTDLSPAMLAVSQQLNPDCEHQPGDMRSLRLGRQFDAVFINDAISHLYRKEDLRAALETAFIHCAPGGAALFCPDCTKENFTEETDTGGADGEGRAMRYLEWRYDPDPDDSWYRVDMAYLLREDPAPVRMTADRLVLGLFSRHQWEKFIQAAGFQFIAEPFRHSTLPEGVHELFIGIKR